MSFLFSGLLRLNVQPAVRFDCEDIDLQQPFNLKSGQLGVKYDPPVDEEQGHKFLVFTNNQSFVVNSQKKFFLENVIFFVPKIFYWFRPNYAVQIATRFSIKMLSGQTEGQVISEIIGANQGIAKYFENFLRIVENIYSGNWLNSVMINEDFSILLIGAFIEILVLNRKEAFEHPMIMPNLLKDLGDNNGMFSTGVQRCQPDWMQRGNKYEICMISANYGCIICKLIFDTTTELKVHILNEHENNFTCMQCKVKFGTYAELLSHKLTFCKHPVFATECSWCQNTVNDCLCGKIQQYVNNTLYQHVQNMSDCKIVLNKMYSIVFAYACEMNQIKMTNNPKYEVHTVEDFTEQSVNALISDLCPIFECHPVSQYPNITCAEWDIKGAPWASIKCRLQPFFDSFMQVLAHIDEISAKSLNVCTVEGCGDRISQDHISKHFICPYARSFHSNELVHFYQINDDKELKNHFLTHTICMGHKVACITCQWEVGDQNGNTIISTLFRHAELHEMDSQSIPKSCSFEGCAGLEFKSLLSYIQHQIFIHTSSASHIVKYLGVIYGDCTPLQTPMGPFYNAAQPEDAIFSTRPRFKGAGYRSRIASRSASPTLAKGILKQGLSDQFEKIHKEQKSLDEQKYVFGMDLNKPDSDEIKCNNEKHQSPWTFNSIIEKTKHIIANHGCPVVKCSFYCEFDAEMVTHMTCMHALRHSCPVCKQRVNILEDHLLTHPKCNACQLRFIDHAGLQIHEPHCKTVKAVVASEILEEECSLNIDTGDSEVAFVQTLHSILDQVSLSETARAMSKLVISKFAAESTLAKSRTRSELISTRRSSQPFFDTPKFSHCERSNLTKILTTIGQVREADKFCADSANSSKCAIENFEQIDNLLRKVERFVSIGFLNEEQTVMVLTLYLSQRIQDEVSSFSGHTELREMSFQEVISGLQFIYCPLKLDKLLTIILNYKINLTYESFLSFSSRVTRHLALCSRIYPAKDRKDFIEVHRRSVIKLNLPVSLVDDIEKKESLFSEYSSAELLEIIVSYLEHNELSDCNLDRSTDSYHVYATQFNPQGTFRRDGVMNNFQSRSDKTDKSDNRGRSQSRGRSQGKSQKVKKVTTFTEKPCVVEKIHTIVASPPPRNFKPPSKANLERTNILKGFGLDNEKENICFMCLGNHIRPHCKIYPRDVEYSEICKSNINGESYIFGFHPKAACKHGSDLTQGKKIPGSKKENRSRNQQQQKGSQYGNQSQASSNWKPYRN